MLALSALIVSEIGRSLSPRLAVAPIYLSDNSKDDCLYKETLFFFYCLRHTMERMFGLVLEASEDGMEETGFVFLDQNATFLEAYNELMGRNSSETILATT